MESHGKPLLPNGLRLVPAAGQGEGGRQGSRPRSLCRGLRSLGAFSAIRRAPPSGAGFAASLATNSRITGAARPRPDLPAGGTDAARSLAEVPEPLSEELDFPPGEKTRLVRSVLERIRRSSMSRCGRRFGVPPWKGSFRPTSPGICNNGQRGLQGEIADPGAAARGIGRAARLERANDEPQTLPDCG